MNGYIPALERLEKMLTVKTAALFWVYRGDAESPASDGQDMEASFKRITGNRVSAGPDTVR